MKNADKFKSIFGLYATEVWAMPEGEFLKWLNSECTETEQGWIPCSERMPESIKPVIITWRNNDPKSYYQYIVGKPFIGTGHYCKGKWFWYSSTCEDLLAEYGRSDVDEVDEAIEVIAWMPLPEPWRGDSICK